MPLMPIIIGEKITSNFFYLFTKVKGNIFVLDHVHYLPPHGKSE